LGAKAIRILIGTAIIAATSYSQHDRDGSGG
jgi:hypothetical protein